LRWDKSAFLNDQICRVKRGYRTTCHCHVIIKSAISNIWCLCTPYIYNCTWLTCIVIILWWLIYQSSILNVNNAKRHNSIVLEFIIFQVHISLFILFIIVPNNTSKIYLSDKIFIIRGEKTHIFLHLMSVWLIVKLLFNIPNINVFNFNSKQ
jgi:hypothetical protein